MPFIAPIIAAAAGLSAIESAVLSAAIGIGLSFAAQKITGKRKSQSASGGTQVSLRVATDAPRDVILGEAYTGGQLVYWHVYGAGNKSLHLVITLASHRIEGVTEIRVDNEIVTWNPSTGAVTEYPGLMTVKVYDGTQTTADAELVANSGGRWTSNEVGRHVAYAAITLTYDQTKFPQGIPAFAFRVRGAHLVDPRTGLTGYTDNPAVIAYNVLRGIDAGGVRLIGTNAPAGAIRSGDAIAAANACDEAITLAAGGTEKRYRCGMVVSADATPRSILSAVSAAMAGQIVSTGGIYRIQAGVAQTAVAHITDSDLIADEPLTTSPRLPRSEIVNTVSAAFADPSLSGRMKPLPARTAGGDVASDGGVFALDLDLTGVFSRTQAQRCMEVARRRARRMMTAQMAVRSRWSVLEAGDWITVTSARRGLNIRTFEVVDRSRREDHVTILTLRETDASIDDWTGDDEIADGAAADLPPSGPGVAEITGVAVANVEIASGSTGSRPGLRVTWTANDDPTMVRLVIEYRKQGDTVALERVALNPNAGQYTWVDGIQGGTVYEVRVRPVTDPERAFAWSSWVATASSTASHVVEVASEALYIAPENIPPAVLDAQSALELTISTALAGVRGSVSERLADLQAQLIATNEALGEALVSVDRADTFARREEVTRVTEDAALAQLIDATNAEVAGKASASAVNLLESRVTVTENGLTTKASASSVTELSTTVGGHTTSLTQMLSVDGSGRKRASLLMADDGKITGGISLDGTQSETVLAFLASLFQFYSPSVNGGVPLPILEVQTVGGTPQLVLNGDLIAQTISAGLLDAVQARIVELIAVLIRSTDSSSYWNLSTGDLQVS